MVFKWDEASAFTPNTHSTRRILAHGGTMMAVHWQFEPEGKIAAHGHPHEQTTYIIEGAFNFIIDGKEFFCTAGDSLYIGPNLVHEGVCLQKGALLDIFTPQRDDFK